MTRTDTTTSTREGKQMAKALKVRSSVKAGGLTFNHREAKGLKVRLASAAVAATLGVVGFTAVAGLGASPAMASGTTTSATDGGNSCSVWRCGFNHSEAGAQRLRKR